MRSIDTTPAKLPRVLRQVSADVAPTLMREVHARAHGLLRSEVERRAPIKQSKGSRPRGALLRSVGSVIGPQSKRVVTADPGAIIRRKKPHLLSRVVITAPHALVIDRPGRRGAGSSTSAQSRRRTGKISRVGSPYGSPQAPRGMTRPGLESLARERRQIFEAASRVAEREVSP